MTHRHKENGVSTFIPASHRKTCKLRQVMLEEVNAPNPLKMLLVFYHGWRGYRRWRKRRANGSGTPVLVPENLGTPVLVLEKHGTPILVLESLGTPVFVPEKPGTPGGRTPGLEPLPTPARRPCTRPLGYRATVRVALVET